MMNKVYEMFETKRGSFLGGYKIKPKSIGVYISEIATVNIRDEIQVKVYAGYNLIGDFELQINLIMAIKEYIAKDRVLYKTKIFLGKDCEKILSQELIEATYDAALEAQLLQEFPLDDDDEEFIESLPIEDDEGDEDE